jgi:hypothetical protein
MMCIGTMRHLGGEETNHVSFPALLRLLDLSCLAQPAHISAVDEYGDF